MIGLEISYSYILYAFASILDNNTAQPYFDDSLISFLIPPYSQILFSIIYHYCWQFARSIKAHPRIWPSHLNDVPKLMIKWIVVREDSLWVFFKDNRSKKIRPNHSNWHTVFLVASMCFPAQFILLFHTSPCAEGIRIKCFITC